MNNTTTKFYSAKSKAQRALKGIGDGALAKASELLFQGTDGRWGFNLDAAEEAQYKAAADKCEISKLLMPKGLPPAVSTTSVRGGKRVDNTSPTPEPAKRVYNTGYSIEAERVEQNGVKRRSKGTLCGQVWDALDAEPAPPTAKRVKELASEKNWNINNALCEYYAWRKFHGIRGRVGTASAIAVAGHSEDSTESVQHASGTDTSPV